jgi:predicted DNA-binding transcriptional regulator YafY
MTQPAAFLAGLSHRSPLSGLAPAPQQLARLLDALLILQEQGRARVSELAYQVGLKPEVLRRLLSSYMVAAAEAVGTAAPRTITFGTSAGPLTGHPSDDEDQAAADVVYLSRRTDGTQLLDDLGRRPVLVEDVARGLLAARAVLSGSAVDERQRALLERLVDRLSRALGASVTAPFDAVTEQLRAAVQQRRRVSFRYRDPWTGVTTQHAVEPYDVRRHRERMFLDAGPDADVGFRSFDVSGMAEVVIDGASTFEPPVLPPASVRAAPIQVVLEVPDRSPAEDRLVDGWAARVLGPPRDGRLQLRIDLDRLNAGTRLGVLLLQLGPGCSVLSPPELVSAAAPVARRLLETLPSSEVAP